VRSRRREENKTSNTNLREQVTVSRMKLSSIGTGLVKDLSSEGERVDQVVDLGDGHRTRFGELRREEGGKFQGRRTIQLSNLRVD